MDPELLESYYSSYFPADQIYSWLTEGRDPRSKDPVLENTFERREFSFTLQGDIYCRHKSFHDSDELRKTLVNILPEKIDIGAVWTLPPKLKGSLANSKKYETVEKEFVIDIDMTDYDNVRTCCSGAKVCAKCWKFLIVACKSVDLALRYSFGFNLILWVFSGRRGIHCWVSDPSAKRLNDFRRKALIEFLNSGPKTHTPFIQIYEEILTKWFVEIVVQDQNLFSNENHLKKLVTIYGENILVQLQAFAPEQVWEGFMGFVNTKPNRVEILMKVMFEFLYPRLDVNVSHGTNHLLKAPFSVHPATGKVCIPFEARNVEAFDLSEVPDIESTCNNNYEFTKAVRLFEGHIEAVKQAAAAERRLLVQDSKVRNEDMEY